MAQANVSEQMALQQQIGTLNTKLDQAEEQLDEMKDATGDAWDEHQASVNALHKQLADAVENAQQTLHLSGTRS